MWQHHVKKALIAALVLVFCFAIGSQAQAAPLNCRTSRLYGATRIDTAIRVSQTGWQQADTVLLARADDFPDSLVAVPLSHRLDAPILLTYPDSLDSAVLSEIQRLGARHVILLGGAATLGQAITDPLQQAGLTWERIGGADRYETAVQIAERLGPNGQAILVSGENFPDALAIAPYAGVTETPILLTAAKGMPASTKAEILKLEPGAVQNGGEATNQTIVVGGEGVIPSATLQGIPAVKRIAGSDRYATAAEVYWFAENVLTGTQPAAQPSAQPAAEPASSVQPAASAQPTASSQPAVAAPSPNNQQTTQPEVTSQPSTNNPADQANTEQAAPATAQATAPAAATQTNQAYLVTGENFPDALVAGALAAKQAAPLFMSASASLPAITYSAMGNAADNALQITLIGGPAILSDQVQKTIEGTVQPSYLLGGLTVAIDPGHGGKDTGAIGPSGTYEKNNTLPVGLALADLLRAAGAKVVLTRTTDSPPTGGNYSELPDLEARVAIANKAKADLFVSIHNDAVSNPAVGGTTTYFCSANPQSAQGKTLAADVQAQVRKQLLLNDRGIKDADFYVIKYTKMPAVLVELGFISNPSEEILLGSPAGRQEAALGIYRGILVYKGY